jgi:hypothetical protein
MIKEMDGESEGYAIMPLSLSTSPSRRPFTL